MGSLFERDQQLPSEPEWVSFLFPFYLDKTQDSWGGYVCLYTVFVGESDTQRERESKESDSLYVACLGQEKREKKMLKRSRRQHNCSSGSR